MRWCWKNSSSRRTESHDPQKRGRHVSDCQGEHLSSIAIPEPGTHIPNFRVLGVRVDAVQIPDAIKVLESWFEDRGPARYVAVTGMHGVSVSREDAAFLNPGFQHLDGVGN